MVVIKKNRTVKQYLKSLKFLKTLTNIISILKGLLIYLNTGITPPKSYISLIELYTFTNGYSNAFLSWLLKLYRSPYTLTDINGALGHLDNQKISQIVEVIKKNGYYIFDQLLPPDICDKLLSFALTKECDLRGAGHWSANEG